MTPEKRKRFEPLQALIAGALLCLAFGRALAQSYTIADVPLIVPAPLAPNVVLTLDDSGSMTWAYVPDAICGEYATRRFKSADFNAMYYNPRLRYEAPPRADGTKLSTSFTNAYRNGFDPSRGTVNLSTEYRVTYGYRPDDSEPSGYVSNSNACSVKSLYAAHPEADYNTATTGDLRQQGVAAYYYVYDPAATACAPAAKTNDDCYRRVVVGPSSGPALADINGDGVIDSADRDERQNFANWYSFYRTRNLATVSAAARAMASDTAAKARVAWQALNSCPLDSSSCSGWSGSAVSNRIARFQGTHKQNFYDWLFRLPAANATPLRTAMGRAGEYFRQSGDDSPYGLDPNQSPTVTGTEHACRPNFHILMTDGIWNSDSDSDGYCSGSICGDQDGTSKTLPDGTNYDPSSALTLLYRGSPANNVADIAFHYWATDLRPDLPNNQIPYYADPSGTAAQQYWNPRNDPANWQHLVTFTVGLGLTGFLQQPQIEWGGNTFAPPGYLNLASGAASWPATGVNVSPGNAYDLWHAAINSRGEAFSAEAPDQLVQAFERALHRSLIQSGSASSVQPNSRRLDTGSAVFLAGFNSADWSGSFRAWTINPGGSLGAVVWDAAAGTNIPLHGARRIVTSAAAVGGGIRFEWPDLVAAGLDSAIGSASLLDYLRGDHSSEQRFGGNRRNRSKRLGDIVNSSPAFAWKENFGYGVLPEGAAAATSYDAFVAGKASRPQMLYVGANDGMLHAFSFDPATATGGERFAYVPRAVLLDRISSTGALSTLTLLADPGYTHRFYVDGTPFVADAFFGGAWRTVLIGSTGAGPRGVFALDVTDPTSFSPANVLWDLDGAGDADLGHVIGRPIIARLNDGEWYAVFGNGYRSANECAVLYLVRLRDGNVRKLSTSASTTCTLIDGLGSPSLYDANGDRIIDYIYAGSVRGELWKFDLSSSSPSAWNVAFGGQPLFVARNASGQVQPITGVIELGRAPAGQSGVMLYFGTGRFFANEDRTDATVQSFYGILDRGSRITATDRSTLRAQTITSAGSTRTVSANVVDWSSQQGWYMDLPAARERAVATPELRPNRLLFTTQIPSDDPCGSGGTSWVMAVDPFNGARLAASIFAGGGDGFESTVGIILDLGLVQTAGKAFWYGGGSRGEIQAFETPADTGARGRTAWRELFR